MQHHVTTLHPPHPRMQELPAPSGSPSKKDAKALAAEKQARGLLARWSSLHSARTVLAGFAFGSSLCGVLLLNKK